MTTQLVTARLQDLVFINEGLEPESLILELKMKDIKSSNIQKTLRQVAPYIAAVHIEGDVFQRYAFMEDYEKDLIVNTMVLLNNMVADDGRTIGLIVDMLHRLPEWSKAEEHVDALLNKYEEAFPNVELWIGNLPQGYLDDGSFNDATFEYIWHTFSDRKNVKMFVDVETLEGELKAFKIADKHHDIAAITCSKEEYLDTWANYTNVPVHYYGSTLDQTLRSDRRVMAQRSKTTKQVNEALAMF